MVAMRWRQHWVQSAWGGAAWAQPLAEGGNVWEMCGFGVKARRGAIQGGL